MLVQKPAARLTILTDGAFHHKTPGDQRRRLESLLHGIDSLPKPTSASARTSSKLSQSQNCTPVYTRVPIFDKTTSRLSLT